MQERTWRARRRYEITGVDNGHILRAVAEADDFDEAMRLVQARYPSANFSLTEAQTTEAPVMQTLEQFNQQQKDVQDRMAAALQPHPIGVECPRCKGELWDTYGATGPALREGPYLMRAVHCPSCKYTGQRFA